MCAASAGAAATGCFVTRNAALAPVSPSPLASAPSDGGAGAALGTAAPSAATGGAAFGSGRSKAAAAAGSALPAKPSNSSLVASSGSGTSAVVPGATSSYSHQPEVNPDLENNNVLDNVLETPGDPAAFTAGLPIFFVEILTELGQHERELGGVRNFSARYPRIERKVTATDFRDKYTDFEYIYLTVLGFAQLHLHCEEIVGKNNGRVYKDNPGVQLLEQRCGMTMHGDRAGAAHLLRQAPASVVEAFALAKMDKVGMQRFFREAFDRTADPCLEGRVSRLMEYLDKRRQESDSTLACAPPWDDVSLRPLDGTANHQDVVGEHLRVFVNECTWRWAGQRGLDYAAAKEVRIRDESAQREFAHFFNANAFEAAMLARGVAADATAKQWEVNTEGGKWMAYSEEQNEVLERARLLGLSICEVRVHSWMYEINLSRLVQLNRKTKKERPIRCIDAPPRKNAGRLTLEELKSAVDYFVGLHTIARCAPDEAPPSPTPVPEDASSESAVAPGLSGEPLQEGERPEVPRFRGTL